MCEYIILEDFIMDKYIYDNSNGLWYELQGDYYIPCLVLPAEKEERHIGVWGQRHLRYLKQHRKVLYSELLISGKLNDYLADLNEQAEEMFSRLVKQLAEAAAKRRKQDEKTTVRHSAGALPARAALPAHGKRGSP